MYSCGHYGVGDYLSTGLEHKILFTHMFVLCRKARSLETQLSASNGVAKPVPAESNAVASFAHLGVTLGLLYAFDYVS
jgi:hypothetical protein